MNAPIRPAALFILALAHASASAQSVLWMRQVGTSSDDRAHAVCLDPEGNLVLAGLVEISIPNQDILLTKFDTSGNLLWMRQHGSPASEFAHGIGADAQGRLYVAGYTSGSLGGINAGLADMFLVRYDSAGTPEWIRQWGTSEHEFGYGLSVDGAGHAYVVGSATVNLGSSNVLLTKYDAAGNSLWTRQNGTSLNDDAFGVALDAAGNAYIAGSTTGSLGGPNLGSIDAYLAKYDPSGNVLWQRQFGTPQNEHVYDIAVDAQGGVYVVGRTSGSLGGPSFGELDGYLARYDPSGQLLWARQIGTPAGDEVHAVAVDGQGTIYVAGFTWGNLAAPPAGRRDVFCSSFSPSGVPQATVQFGSHVDDTPTDLVIGADGFAYVVGYTNGSLAATNLGRGDLFLAKLDLRCRPDLTTTAVAGSPGYLVPDGLLNNEDFFAFLAEYAAGNLTVCDLTTGALPIQPGYGVPNGILTTEDFFFYLTLYSQRCGS